MKKAERRLTQSIVGIAICGAVNLLCSLVAVHFEIEDLIYAAWGFTAATFYFTGASIYWSYEALKPIHRADKTNPSGT